MTTRTFTTAGSMAGKTFSGSSAREGGSETNGELTLEAGSPGELTTRTDNDTGVVTLEAGHGQTNGTYDVFWDGGIRRGMTGTIATNALSLDGGAGDNLPALTTEVVVDKQETIDLDSTAASIVLAAVSQQRRASVQFQQSNGTAIKSLDLGRYAEGSEPWLWASETDVSTPFGADIGQVVVSNGSSAGTNKVTIGILRS